MTHRLAAWKLLFEEAALRRDARAFALIVQSIPELARAAVKGAADYRYALPYFDDVVFRQNVLHHGDRVQYMRLGRLHRDHGPADQLRDGTEAWYLHGERHNENGPAVITPHGYIWFLHGKQHRVGGPAEFFKQNEYEKEEWFRHGKRHRVGGPAVKDNNEEKWYIDGQLHRDDGPAVIVYNQNGATFQTWYRRGKYVEGRAVVHS